MIISQTSPTEPQCRILTGCVVRNVRVLSDPNWELRECRMHIPNIIVEASCARTVPANDSVLVCEMSDSEDKSSSPVQWQKVKCTVVTLSQEICQPLLPSRSGSDRGSTKPHTLLFQRLDKFHPQCSSIVSRYIGLINKVRLIKSLRKSGGG
jgi:hypothetical protein